MIATVKKWLSTFVTALLLLVLFGLIFVRLDLIELTTTFWLELGIVATLTCIVRFFWYNEGEDRAMHDQDIIDLKTNYSKLVEDTIQSQEDLDTFVEKLNVDNRAAWVKRKLKGRTPKSCPKYDEIKQKLIEKAYCRVPMITSTQILTRSAKYETINATDYTKSRKIMFQTTGFITSVGMSILLGVLAYKELLLNWENLFRYLTYVWSIVWALVSSLMNGYKTYRNTTIDHISRLTMIVNRYAEWTKGGKECKPQQDLTQTS